MVEHPAFNRVVPSSTLGRGTLISSECLLEASPIVKRQAILWWTLTIIAAIAFLFVAASDTVYDLTSPPGPLQILLRKSYSLGAFALVGYPLSRALEASNMGKSALFVATAVATYSLGIEIVQAIVGSHEGLGWNAADVAFGFAGGYLGAAINECLRPHR